MHNNKTILCVEDHGDTCELISAVFPEYKITSVDSVADGHYMIGRSEFDLYLFDYHLPDGTGEDLCRYLRGRGAEQPVVIFTGSSWIRGRQVRCERRRAEGRGMGGGPGKKYRAVDGAAAASSYAVGVYRERCYLIQASPAGFGVFRCEELVSECGTACRRRSSRSCKRRPS